MESHSVHHLPLSVAREKKPKRKRARSPVNESPSIFAAFSPSPFVTRLGVKKPKVFIRVVFLKIGEIDTLKEQFRAEIFVQARWREPRLDNCHNVEEVQWEELWNPQLQLENAMDEPQSSVWHDLVLSNNREAFVLEKRRVKADFAENLELQNFPFDMQHLSILITSQLSESSLELLEDGEELSSVNLLSFVDEQEWNVRDIVEAIPETRCREFSSVQHKFPMITVRTYAIRRAGFFVWNVLAIMVLICSLSLCTFSVDRKLPQNRLQLSFTLVLTGIAFKFVVGQSLPKISYLTVLDKYILGSMVLMHVVSVWHAIITRFKNHPDLADTLDDWAFIVLVFIFSSYNVGYTLIMIVKTYMKRKFIDVLETAYKAKVQRLLKEGKDTQRRGRVMKKHRHHQNSNNLHPHHNHRNPHYTARVHALQP
ncbi:cys-loop ligand-gated ion channel-like [Babylonia areolata]|uniref:cys-loop ligand-gated ion channel-like n=1 Tax=Babylonia areolata TaxID=304850 RepID=UPI003FD27A16